LWWGKRYGFMITGGEIEKHRHRVSLCGRGDHQDFLSE
jgi:hypothetical protein